VRASSGASTKRATTLAIRSVRCGNSAKEREFSVGRSVGRSVVRSASGGHRAEYLLERGQENRFLDELDGPELHRRDRRRYVSVAGQHSDRRVDST
jgi:hypothetical protein